MGWKVNDLGDVRCAIDADAIDGYKDIHAHNFSIIGQYCAAIYDRVKVAAESNDFLLMLGGDHSIPVGTIPAILSSRPQTGVLWVDAHADINTTQTSPSGNMHGMPVAMLMGLEEMLPSLPPFDWFSKLDFPANRDGSKKTACLSAKDLVYVGLREVDEGERALIKDLGIKAFTMADVDRIGIGGVMKEVKDHFESRDLDIHCSFDIDAIDPLYAPHTGTCVDGGLSRREANFITEELHASGRLRSLELVEVNPLKPSTSGDGPQKTIDLSLQIIGGALGRTIL